MTRTAARRVMRRVVAPGAATARPLSGRLPLALVVLIAVAARCAPAAAAATPAKEPARPPLTNEDVVRLVVYGTNEEVILKEIAARPPAFDLDPGVVVELERVGVSVTIIDAMRRRQGSVARPQSGGSTGQQTPGPSTETPPPVAAPTGSLEIAFAPSADGKPVEIFAIATKPKGAPRPEKSEIGTVSDLAIAILCTTGDHVPDHWDTLTPLAAAPRHELVLFRPGSHRYTDKGFELLALDRLPVGPVPLVTGHHALLIGLAGKQSGTGDWRLFAMATIKVDIADGKTTKLLLDARSTLSGMRMTGYHVDEIWTVRDPAAQNDRPPADKDAPAPAP